MGQCKTKKRSSYHNSVPTISRALSDINDVRSMSKYPSKKSQKMIKTSLSKHNLFSKMTHDDFLILLHDIIFYQFPSDRSVFDQGEAGSLFYLVESGKLAVIRSGVKKTILQQGDYFGDMALLTDFPRRATIKTIEASELWAINRDSFLKVVQSINHRSAFENQEFISKLKIFFNLPNNQMKKLASNLVQQEFPDSTRIICEGDEGILLHIIKQGQAVVKMHGSEMFRLIEGEMFGESAVLGLNRIYQFSVYSVGKLVVLSLSIENIQKILGDDFKGILYKNQAKNSILSNKYFKLMSRENVDRIIENLDWKLVQVNSEPLCNPLEGSLVYIVAYGTLSCGEIFFKQHEVIGFMDKKKRLERLRGQIKAESDVIVGSIFIDKIEEIGKMHFKEIKNRLKIVNILKKLEFFAEISQKKLRFIADTTRKVKFENKELIYKFNDEAKTFFIVKSGGVKIYQNGKMLRVLGKYDIFGDNCLYEKTRCTNAKAVSQCKCLVIQGEDFKEIMNSNADFFLRRTRSSLSLFKLNELIFLKFIRKDEQRHCFVTHLHNNEFFFYVEVLDKNSVVSNHSFEKLLHEKNIAISIEHPLIMRLLQTFSDSQFIYMVYENFHINPLASILDSPLSEDQSKFLSASLLTILECLHEKQVIYREFDPNHLSITNKGYPFISSFRSAKVVKERTRTMIGNFAYCAPEQITGKGYTKSVNFWSLGVMIYQFLYGELPFNIEKLESPSEVFQVLIKARLVFPQDSKFIRANELIARLLHADGDKRAGLDEVKFSRWLDSVDWQRISTVTFESPLKICISGAKSGRQKEEMSLTRYLHEVYFSNFKSGKPVVVNQKKQINWDKFF